MGKDRSTRDDKNNAHWTQNKTRFGFKMLEKMGWKEGKGLGKDLSGSTEHVKVRVKQDDAGIGAKFDAGSWKNNFGNMDDMLKRMRGKDDESGAAAAAAAAAADADVFVPRSPKQGAAKPGVLVASRRMYNRKLVKAKMEHRTDDRNRAQLLGQAKRRSPAARPVRAEVSSDEESSEDEGVDQVVKVQKKAAVSLADYFKSKARAAGDDVAEHSAEGTFMAFNAGTGVAPSEAAQRKRMEADAVGDKKRRKEEKAAKKARKEEKRARNAARAARRKEKEQRRKEREMKKAPKKKVKCSPRASPRTSPRASPAAPSAARGKKRKRSRSRGGAG